MLLKGSMPALVLLFFFLLTSCDPQRNINPIQNQSEMQRVVHQQGTTVIPKYPKKVEVFNPETLDILNALGVPVIGVPKTSRALPGFLHDYYGKHYANVGTLFEPDYEELSRIAPDLIIAGGRTNDAYTKLTEIAPTISLPIDPKHFTESLSKNTLELGHIFNKEEMAKVLLAQFENKVAMLKKRISKDAPRVLIIMVSGGKMSTYGPGSRFGFIFDELGFRAAIPAAKTSTHGNLISAELLLKADPDWLFVIDRDRAINSKELLSAKQIIDNPLTHNMPVLRNNRILYLDSTAMYIAGGLQTYSQLMDQLNAKLDFFPVSEL